MAKKPLLYNSDNLANVAKMRTFCVGRCPLILEAAGLTTCVPIYKAIGDCSQCSPDEIIWEPVVVNGVATEICPDNNEVVISVPGNYMLGAPDPDDLVLAGDVNITCGDYPKNLALPPVAAPQDPATLALLEAIVTKLCEPLQVELTGDSIAALQAAFTAAIETAEWPELEVTLNGEVIEVTGTVALDAATLAALEEITVTGVVGLDAATIAALVDALQGLEVNLSAENIADLVSALEAATLTVTVDSGNITVDGTVDIGNFQDLIDGLQGLEVTIPGTVEVTGTVALDPATIAALSFDYEKSVTKLCNADGEWTVCNFINAKDPNDIVGPVYINPLGAVAENPGDLVACKSIVDVIKPCPAGPEGADPTRGFQYINGRPNANAPWQLVSNLGGQNNMVVIEGANLQEFIANMEAAGYTEWSFGEQHFFCPCPPGYTEQGSYTIAVDGDTTVKIECLPLAEFPGAPEKAGSELDVVCTKDKNSDAALAKLCEIAANTTPDPDCCVPPDGQMLGGAGSDMVTVAGNFEGATELDIVQADGSTQTVAVTNTAYNAANNTTTATLAQATSVKAVKVKAREGVIVEGAGTRNLIVEGNFASVTSVNLIRQDGAKSEKAVAEATFVEASARTALKMDAITAKTAVRVERITEGEGKR